MYPRVIVQNFGPFEHVELEIRPLTIIVGKNSVGKSMILYLLWTLTIATPDFATLGDLIFRNYSHEKIISLYNNVFAHIMSGKAPNEAFKELARIFIKTLPDAIAPSVKKLLHDVFVIESLQHLIQEGKSYASIEVRGAHGAHITFSIRENELRIYSRYLPYKSYIEHINIEVPAPRRVIFRGLSISTPYEDYLSSVTDVRGIIGALLADYVLTMFAPFFTSEEYGALLVDGRAGIARTLLKPYLSPNITKGLMLPDEQFVSLYYRLAEKLYYNQVRKDLIDPILRELGCKIESLFERGTYVIHIQTWTGKRLPFEKTPSGIRETLVVALALASEGNPRVVFIEEPEAHLHPRAQRLLARLIARAVNELGKTVIITTHSDYIVYSLSNLVALSGSKEKARELGYLESEILDPDKVAVYLVKPEGCKAVVERLNVTSEGIPEDEFAEIAAEIADERARIYASRSS